MSDVIKVIIKVCYKAGVTDPIEVREEIRSFQVDHEIGEFPDKFLMVLSQAFGFCTHSDFGGKEVELVISGSRYVGQYEENYTLLSSATPDGFFPLSIVRAVETAFKRLRTEKKARQWRSSKGMIIHDGMRILIPNGNPKYGVVVTSRNGCWVDDSGDTHEHPDFFIEVPDLPEE